MNFVVEDGTGLPNANSYCEVDFFRDYWSDRGVDYTGKTDEELQGLLVQATQYIDRSYRYIGRKLTKDQSLQFPRIYFYDGTFYKNLPIEIKLATCEAVKVIIDGGELFSNVSDLVTEKSEAVGVIKTTYKYQTASQVGKKVYQSILTYLRDFIYYKSNVVYRY